MTVTTFSTSGPRQQKARWSGVFAMSLCVFVLIASEFLPVSLLTPIARDLALTEGQAGQAIAVSGIFAVLTSLCITALIGSCDRKHVLLALTLTMLLSGAVVTFAPNYTVLMLGRALVGIVVGGFWSLSAATVMRLVPESSLPKALAILNGGNALATTIAAPLGSFLGGIIGWRGAFFCVVPIAALVFCWQAVSLPALPSVKTAGKGNVFRLLLDRKVALGMAATMFLFTGQFALFTYLRPFLETVTRVDLPTLSLLLLVVGGAGVIGTLLIGVLLNRSIRAALIGMPLIMAAIALGLIIFGHTTPSTAVLLAGWGMIGTAAPVGWWTWLSRSLPQSVEEGGGLMVAIIQFGITLGASVGGWLFDAFGYQATFGFSAGLLVIAGLLAIAASSGLTMKASPDV